jgi:hypothetical protein
MPHAQGHGRGETEREGGMVPRANLAVVRHLVSHGVPPLAVDPEPALQRKTTGLITSTGLVDPCLLLSPPSIT